VDGSGTLAYGFNTPAMRVALADARGRREVAVRLRPTP
jgi:hypothetical protein